MRSRITRKASLLAVGLAAAALSALTPATDFVVSTASGAPTAKDPLRPYAQQKLRWKRCDAKGPATFRCATLKVPLDYGDPGGRTIDLAISRLKAGSAKARHGVLLLNPGGPGGPGLHLPVDPLMKYPAEVRRRYDLVGFDPRGVGRSSPVSCGLTAEEQADRPYKAETFAKDVARARTIAGKCRARAGGKLAHLTTRNSARDMDVIRAALGEKTISYLGASYGTYLGAVYTQLFPRRADRFVLDSATDPTRIYRGMFQDMAKAAEHAFTRWTAWTARRHAAYGLGDTPAKVRKTYWDLIARANREPIVFEGQPLTGDAIRADNSTFFHVQRAAERIAGLRRAAKGSDVDPAPSGTPGQGAEAPDDHFLSSAWSVMCADTRTWSHDPAQYRREAIRDKARYPLYGDFAAAITPCAFWQRGSEPQTRIDNGVGALITQNEWDSQTPLFAGRALHRALRGSRLLTVAGGEGHGVLYAPDGNRCADKAATHYLTTGRLPAKDLTCRTPRTP
ncbi:alpha/beta hydrolase [Streptomyces kanamyceticus]|uniref:Alpha/beta hydrolase n=1 Tax=Streptomyces kanamyceticus TaxID=1967 RepID=A0A5J6GLL9_STRKN|nr:alpha/beta hydrolase [Streptomyces kanamyceticus]QEU93926.1 alpha/beta hydrolase [Streptomyces kanamyceticus]